MKPTGFALLLVGVIALIYQGISFTTQEKVLDIGPIEVKKETRRNIPLPPLLGALALLSGTALLVTTARKS